MNRKLAALVAATGLAFVGSAAVAAPATETRQVTVNYADLNLKSAAGVEALYSRLRTASRQVCGSASGLDVASARDMRACRARALSGAVAKIDNAALNARHFGTSEAKYAMVMDR